MARKIILFGLLLLAIAAYAGSQTAVNFFVGILLLLIVVVFIVPSACWGVLTFGLLTHFKAKQQEKKMEKQH
jgi:hypothetical protein